MADLLLVNEDSKGKISKYWQKNKSHQKIIDIYNWITRGGWRNGQKKNGIRAWVSDSGKNVYSVSLPDGYEIVFEALRTFDLPAFIYPILSSEGNLTDVDEKDALALHVIIHDVKKIDSQQDSLILSYDDPIEYNLIEFGKPDIAESEEDQLSYNEELYYLMNQKVLQSLLKGKEKGLLLHLTYEQAIIMRRLPGPFLLSGEAGSGKTTIVTLWLLLNVLQNSEVDNPGRQLFVTFSERLKQETERKLELMLHSKYNTKDNPKPDGKKNPVEFKTYRELLREIAVDGRFSENFPREKEIDLSLFISRHGFKFIQQGLNPHLAWDEIRSVIKGGWVPDWKNRIIDLEEYKKLKTAKKQCKIENHQKEKYWKLTKDIYQEDLDENGDWDAIDLARACCKKFNDLEMEGYFVPFEKLACDEVQDLAPVEIRLLMQTITDRVERDKVDDKEIVGDKLDRMFLTGDQAQVINPSGFRWSKTKDILYEESKRNVDIRKEIELERNFRCTDKIVSLANLFIEQRKAMGLYSPANEQISFKEGEYAAIIEQNPIEELKKLGEGNDVDESERVIIVKNIDQKRKLIGKLGLLDENNAGIILTVEESKGLEWKVALLWNFFEPAASGLERKNPWSYVFDDKKRKFYKKTADWKEKNRYELEHEYNLLHVAITRAKEKIFIFDEGKEFKFSKVEGISQVSSPIDVILFTEEYKDHSKKDRDPDNLRKSADKLWNTNREQSAKLYVKLARWYREEKRFMAAASCFEISAIVPDPEEGEDPLFRLPKRSDRYRGAAECYKSAGSEGLYCKNMGEVHILDQEYSKAAKSLFDYADICYNSKESSKIRNEKTIEAYLRINDVFEGRGDDNALEILKESNLGLAKVHSDVGNDKQSIKYYEKVFGILKKLYDKKNKAKKYLNEEIEIIDRLIDNLPNKNRSEVAGRLFVEKSEILGNYFKDYSTASVNANKAYLIYQRVGSVQKQINALEKVRTYQEKGGKFDVKSRLLMVELYKRESLNKCREEWKIVIDHQIGSGEYDDAYDQIISMVLYLNAGERFELSVDDLSKYAKEFGSRKETELRTELLEEALKILSKGNEYSRRSEVSMKLARIYHENKNDSERRKYVIAAGNDMLYSNEIDKIKEATKIFEVGAKWIRDSLYPGDAANYCLKIVYDFGLKNWTSIRDDQSYNDEEKNFGFIGKDQIEFVKYWCEKAASYWSESDRGIKSIDKNITMRKRGGRIPPSGKLRVAWLHYCKYLVLKTSGSEDKDVLRQVRQARKIVPKGGETDYHGVFEEILDKAQERTEKEKKKEETSNPNEKPYRIAVRSMIKNDGIITDSEKLALKYMRDEMDPSIGEDVGRKIMDEEIKKHLRDERKKNRRSKPTRMKRTRKRPKKKSTKKDKKKGE